MSGKVALERAQKVANAVVDKLAPHCQRIQVAGSIRRGMPWVNDIDILLMPADPWNLEHQILALCRPFKPQLMGGKLKRLRVAGIQVDLYFATPETWATLLLIRTGPKESNIKLCSLAKKKGWHLHADGQGLFDEASNRIAGETESSIYHALGVKYEAPEARNLK